MTPKKNSLSKATQAVCFLAMVEAVLCSFVTSPISPSGGDLIIELKSQVPSQISSKAERLLKELEQEGF